MVTDSYRKHILSLVATDRPIKKLHSNCVWMEFMHYVDV